MQQTFTDLQLTTVENQQWMSAESKEKFETKTRKA